MRSPYPRLLSILLLVTILGSSCAAGQALTSGQEATAEEVQVAGETASSLQSEASTAGDEDQLDDQGSQTTQANDTAGASEVEPGAATETTVAQEDFAGGELQLPRSFRYGLIDIDIVDAQVVGGQSRISLQLSNPHEQNISSVPASLFRILEGDQTWIELDYADDEYSVDVEPRGVIQVDLVGESVELTTSALQVNDRDTVPIIVPFGGTYEPSSGQEVAAGQAATSVVYDCGSEGNISIKTAVTRATIVLDVDVARSGYTPDLGRAKEEQRFLRVEAEFEQLARCDRALEVSAFDIEIDGNSDYDVEMIDTKLLENSSVTGVMLFSFPVGADSVTFVIGEGESVVIPVG